MKKERKSGMTPEALKELDRRFRAGEPMGGLFSLKTGKPIRQSKDLEAINAELMTLNLESRK